MDVLSVFLKLYINHNSCNTTDCMSFKWIFSLPENHQAFETQWCTSFAQSDKTSSDQPHNPMDEIIDHLMK